MTLEESNDLISGRTRGGEEWIPQFVSSLNAERCIGCGRCFKVCPREVFKLTQRGDLIDEEDDDDLYNDDDEMMVMTISDIDDCIGCMSCSRVCPKQCHTHEPVAA